MQNVLKSLVPPMKLTFLFRFMHRCDIFSPDITICEGALHAYEVIETANHASRALDVVVHDDEHEPESGPASRSASTYRFRPQKRGRGGVTRLKWLSSGYIINITYLWPFARSE